MRTEFANIPTRVREPIVCSDLRSARVMSDELANLVLEAMRETNRFLYRSAILAPSPLLALQITRLSRDAHNPRRRVFATAGELEVWLESDLTLAERERLHAFVTEPPPPELLAGADAPPWTRG
jgi:hypothetical protein